MHGDTNAVAAHRASIRLERHVAERINRYRIGDHEDLTDRIVRPRGLARLEMACRKQDDEDDKNATHRSLSGGPNQKGRAAKFDVRSTLAARLAWRLAPQ